MYSVKYVSATFNRRSRIIATLDALLGNGASCMILFKNGNVSVMHTVHIRNENPTNGHTRKLIEQTDTFA